MRGEFGPDRQGDQSSFPDSISVTTGSRVPPTKPNLTQL
ncbi:hypothetical protein BF49_2625 [Bradyrhizobium sp.]|nr:hypothetical protein BF49_2625 [Bradyrhizobium sp.]